METPKLSPAKINPTKLLPGISISTKKISTESLQEESVSVLKSDLFIIKKQVFKVRDLIQTSTLIKQSELEKKRKSTEKKEAEKQENKLEAKPEKKEGKLKMPSVPKLGFLDRIKNFLFSVLLGYISIKLLPHLPKLVGIVSIIGNVMEFMIDLGGNILDKVVTFIDWGYKAIDATRGFMKSFGGDFSLKIFDTFTGAVSGVIDAAIIASIAIAGQGKDGVLDIGMDLVKDRLLGQGAKTAAQAGTQAATGAGGTAAGGGATAGGTAAQAGGIGTGAVAAIILGAGLLASALGEGAFQLKKMSVGMEQGAKKAYDGEKNPLMKPIRWLMYQGAKFISFQLGTVGTLLDIVGTPFRYAIELIRYPFLDEKGKEAQSKNLAKFDARIREQFREGLNALTFGLVGGGGEGSFGSLFGDKGTKGMGYAKQAEGGPAPVTRGNKIVGGAVKRTISRKPVKRGVKVQVTKVKPGSSIGGKKKIEKIFPEVPTKDKGKNVNPLGYMQSSYNIATKTPSFGALFALPLKAQLGEKPSSVDYMKAAEELSGWMQNTFRGTAGYAGGGKVEAGMFGGDDTTNVIAKSLEENISSKVDAAIKELQKQLMLKEGEKETGQKKTGPDGEDGEFEVGAAGNSGDALTMARNLMRDLGLTAEQAAGIVGNMIAESGVENARPQNTPPGTKGVLKVDDVTGYGIVQWTSRGRQQALADYAKSKGADLSKPLSMNIEYQFFLKEFKGQYGQVLSQIKQAKDVKTASTIFMQQYEVPAGYKTEAKIMERYNKSKPIYDKLAKGEGKATEGPGTYIDNPLSGKLGAGYGSGGSKIAGDLGNYMKQVKIPTGEVHQHPKHPGWSKRSYQSYHNEGRAIDLGGYGPAHPSSGGKDEQAPIIKAMIEWNKKNNVTPVELIHGSPAFSRFGKYESSPNALHSHHVHVAYAKGGRVTKPTRALIGEKGPEFIFDADTTAGLDSMTPNLLEYLNAAKTKSQLMGVLQSYAGYEDGAEQTVIVMSNPQMIPIPIPTGNSGSIGGMSRSSSIDTTYDTQYANA
jgi:hypothetical protein